MAILLDDLLVVVTLTVNSQVGKAVLCQAMVRGPLAMAWQALSERLRADPMGADLSSVEIGAKASSGAGARGDASGLTHDRRPNARRRLGRNRLRRMWRAG
jgi:hypothetical protein